MLYDGYVTEVICLCYLFWTVFYFACFFISETAGPAFLFGRLLLFLAIHGNNDILLARSTVLTFD